MKNVSLRRGRGWDRSLTFEINTSRDLRHRKPSLRTSTICNHSKAPEASLQLMHCLDLWLSSWLPLKAFAMLWLSIGVLCCANRNNCYTTLFIAVEIQMKASPVIYSPLESINYVQTNVKSTAKQFITSSFFETHSVIESFNPVMWFSDTSTQTISPIQQQN